jgi:L-alanine-DL-glutamate epimerase-like enolase superfamily enzyme
MKIKSIDVMEVVYDFQGAISKWRPIVVRINTDEGISGFGEVGMAYGCGQSAAFGMVKDYAQLILGKDPMQTEAIWEILQRKTFWGQGGGTVIYAGMSGIDTALWDIKGKALGVPVYQLLGGKMRDKVRAYASQLQFGWGAGAEKSLLVEPEEYGETALKMVAEGFTAIKVDPLAIDDQGVIHGWHVTGPLSGKVLSMGYERIKAIREAVGSNIDILVELHGVTDTTAAIQFGKQIEELNIFLYEEPVMSLNPKQMKKVADHVNIPLAAGERIYSRWGYREFFENGSLDIIQPDLGNCGGITEGKKICDMAHVYDVTVQCHVAGGPIATAVALQLEAALPNFIIHELHRYALLSPNINLCKYDYQVKNGYYEVPDLPGIGQELNEATIKNAIIATVD